MRNYQTRNLTDVQWALLDPLIPMLVRGAYLSRNRREVLNGILFVLRTGIPWGELPKRYPSARTCRRRLREWTRDGIMRAVIEKLAEDLRVRGRLDLRAIFAGSHFAPVLSNPVPPVRAKGVRGHKAWRFQTAELLLSLHMREVLYRAK